MVDMSEITQNENPEGVGEPLPNNAGVNALIEGTIVEDERTVFTLRSLSDAEEVDDENEKKEHSSFPYVARRKLFKQLWVVDEIDDAYDRDNIKEDVYDRLFDYYYEYNLRLEDLDFRSDDIVAYFSKKGE